MLHSVERVEESVERWRGFILKMGISKIYKQKYTCMFRIYPSDPKGSLDELFWSVMKIWKMC